jgi:pimeloyl-ACP methyl ester carboxylesterase
MGAASHVLGGRVIPAGSGTPDSSVVLVDGPWTHRDVSANGVRLHVAEAGTGPLVLLLHGFPEFWWSWRHQLVGLADAGFRVVAPDLRGYGASDKPPRGYDAVTLAADVAGLVRALGERDAMIVGHDWGGLLAWTTGTLHPRVVRRLAVLAAPHPRRLRNALVTDPRGQLRASRYAFGFQAPRLAESLLTRNDAEYVGTLFERWSAPAWRRSEDYAEAVRRCREAVRIPKTAHCALEYYRWMLRSVVRPDGRRYAKSLSQPVTAPTLQLHGGLDSSLLPRTAQGSGRYVAAAYEWRLLDGVGHFAHQEAPERVTGELLRWAKD